MPDPLESLVMQVRPLDDLPLYTSKAERKKPISPIVRQVNQLVELARPFAQDMKLLKPHRPVNLISMYLSVCFLP